MAKAKIESSVWGSPFWRWSCCLRSSLALAERGSGGARQNPSPAQLASAQENSVQEIFFFSFLLGQLLLQRSGTARAKPKPACVFMFGFSSMTHHGMEVAGPIQHTPQRQRKSKQPERLLPGTWLGAFEPALGLDSFVWFLEIILKISVSGKIHTT